MILARRAIIIVMDGCGVGALPDASDYGGADARSATLPHVAEAVGGLHLPVLERLGLGNIVAVQGVIPGPASAGWGRMAEASAVKDSVTGHWEMMGIVTKTPFPTYPNGFPPEAIAQFEHLIGRRTLGNVAASGTEIIRRLGAENVRTGRPIVYTSADSVFQVAAHEKVIAVEDLYRMCEAARAMLVTPHDVQRVIARPFVGDAPAGFRRTAHRRDFPLAPPTDNLLEALSEARRTAHAIGVVADLFPRDCFAAAERTQTNTEAFAAIHRAVQSGGHDLVFANCEDFDMLYGHRNDPRGFAAALMAFDMELGAVLEGLRPEDLLILTADHGNDPTTASTDHSREYVPLLVYGAAVSAGPLGIRASFADVAASVAAWLEVPWTGPGVAFAGGC